MRSPLFLALLSLGCGPTIVLAPSTSDSGGPPADLGAQPADVAADANPDANSNADASLATDASALVDATVASLNGRWRLTRFEFDGEDGARRTLTDVDAPLVNAAGETVPARANGTLTLADDRLALSVSTLINNHFYVYGTGYSANGFGAPGLLDQVTGRFTLPGSAMGVSLLRNADGTVSITGDGFGTNRLTYSRAPIAPSVDRLSAIGLAMIAEMPPPPTGPNLRVALFWDLVGAVPNTETHGVAVRFAGRFATYPIVLAGPPPVEVRARIGIATVALARVALYVDQDGSLTYDRTIDRGVAISPVAIAWRDDAVGVETVNTPVRDLTPGYQYVHVHADPGLGRAAVTPFDNTHLVAPDLPVSFTSTTIPMIIDVL